MLVINIREKAVAAIPDITYTIAIHPPRPVPNTPLLSALPPLVVVGVS